ncbi:hypothetical protein IJI55_01855 [Candidatus Saccharibacteria bacterium]|nr:hypothetical protein [Candidatus Saccharibacteria bacterium]MBR3323580.1 hypothetical protein [Candidatus Saccharibacteria bacterium]
MNNNDDNTDITLTQAELEKLSDDQLLDLYCEQMMIDKGLDNLEGDTRKQVRDELKERLNFEINRSILAALPEEKFNEIDAVTTENDVDMDVVERVIKESGIDVDKITEETMKKFRELYLEA